MKALFQLTALLSALFLIQGCNGMPMKVYSVEVLNAEARKDKNLFNGKRIADAALDGPEDGSGRYGVELEDMVIRDLTMDNVRMCKAHFKNVTFVDCTFVKVDFRESKFENVKFIRGSISGYAKPDLPRDYETDFRGVEIDRLLFDGVSIGRSVHMNFFGSGDGDYGVVVLRNVTVKSREKDTAMLLYGWDLHVRIDNCVVEDQYGVSISGDNSTAYITNSRFINARLKIGGKAAWVENCTLGGSDAPEAESVVIKNCRLDAVGVDIGKDGQRTFLVNNTYADSMDTDGISLWLFRAQQYTVKDNAHLYLYGPAHIPGKVWVDSGNVHIYGAEIDKVAMRQQYSKNMHLASLNLQNVKLGQADWKLADVRQGKWENVQFGAPIDLNQAKIGPISGHKVTFAGGSPWINGKLDITDSARPLEFDKPSVPTLEELGLAQFWKEHDFPVETY